MSNTPFLQSTKCHSDGHVRLLAQLSDEKQVVAASNNHLTIWNLESEGGEPEWTLMENRELCDFAVTKDGTKIISCGDTGHGRDSRIKVWDVESRMLAYEWKPAHEGNTVSLAISPDDQFVACGGTPTVGVYSIGGELRWTIDVGEGLWTIWSISFSPDGDKLVCGTDNEDIYLYEVETGKPLVGPLEGHTGTVNCVLWSRDGSRFFSAAGDIRCWNSTTGQQIGQSWTGHAKWITSLSLSPEGSILASSSYDGTVRFWDTDSGHEIEKCLQHSSCVYAVSFTPSGEFVVTAGHGGAIYLWHAPQSNSLVSRPLYIHGLCGPHGLIRVLNVHPPPPYSANFPYAKHVPNLAQSVYHSHPTVPIPNPDQNGYQAVETSFAPDETYLRFVLPDMSLPPDERQRIFDLQCRKLFDLATSNGLRTPGHLSLASTSQEMSNNSGSKWDSEIVTDNDPNLTPASSNEPPTSVFRCSMDRDPKKVRKIDQIKQRLIEMLREIGFNLPKDRLPWSTLERELEKKGFRIVNWPEGVVREKDKGVYSLGAEDADRLYRALFFNERPLQFVPRDSEVGITSLAIASRMHIPPASDGFGGLKLTGKQARFRVTTAQAFAQHSNKRRRVDN